MICTVHHMAFFLAQAFVEYCLCPRRIGERVKIESFVKLSVRHPWDPAREGQSKEEVWVPLGCSVSGQKTLDDMLWKLQDVNRWVPTALRGRRWSSREVAAVLSRNHKGAQWTQ